MESTFQRLLKSRTHTFRNSPHSPVPSASGSAHGRGPLVQGPFSDLGQPFLQPPLRALWRSGHQPGLNLGRRFSWNGSPAICWKNRPPAPERQGHVCPSCLCTGEDGPDASTTLKPQTLGSQEAAWSGCPCRALDRVGSWEPGGEGEESSVSSTFSERGCLEGRVGRCWPHLAARAAGRGLPDVT